jgi:hypothetical protein
MVAHLMPTPYFAMACAASTVIWSLVRSLDSIPRSKYLMSLDEFPDDPGHFVSIQFHNRIRNFNFLCHENRIFSEFLFQKSANLQEMMHSAKPATFVHENGI